MFNEPEAVPDLEVCRPQPLVEITPGELGGTACLYLAEIDVDGLEVLGGGPQGGSYMVVPGFEAVGILAVETGRAGCVCVGRVDSHLHLAQFSIGQDQWLMEGQVRDGRLCLLGPLARAGEQELEVSDTGDDRVAVHAMLAQERQVPGAELGTCNGLGERGGEHAGA